jgi:hypothetical protein
MWNGALIWKSAHVSEGMALGLAKHQRKRERECPGGNLDISHTRLSCSHKLVAKPDTVGSTKEWPYGLNKGSLLIGIVYGLPVAGCPNNWTALVGWIGGWCA